ncbi:conserved hypothetical protein [Hoeflea sp. EC-HK425]|nr:YchJ family metal-binding protein [Hoeflea sp. EC-HK425]VVT19578.1 conserved hypothetical protein [Hoeflea sp. EC-HK425]|tara:strand:+ start:5990 stop:6283 length:294 start_codon:yes stop_codon:yes gene_type:complete
MARLGMRWTGLQIHDLRDGGPTDERGTVRYISQGAPGALEEAAAFRKVTGRWLYSDRMETRAPGGAGAQKPVRNDPCPAGLAKYTRPAAPGSGDGKY